MLLPFQYSKAAGKIKEAISSLPPATTDDDNDEAAALALAENKASGIDNCQQETTSPDLSESNKGTSDPFGLDALLPSTSKKDERSKVKEVTAVNRRAEEEESKGFIKSQREVLLLCLEIAAKRYKVPWSDYHILTDSP